MDEGATFIHRTGIGKEVRTVRRLALLATAGAVWLFLAAAPVFADGGPHMLTLNNGAGGITADGCAGCHRTHTAQGQMLLAAANEELLCLSCHGNTANGATTNVLSGVQYSSDARTTLLGALRNGGFEKARIGSSIAYRLTYMRTSVDPSFRTKVPALAAGEDVTSAHIGIASTVTLEETAWGNGANGATSVGAGPVDLECTSCHNPHGNGQFRILNKMPYISDDETNAFLKASTLPISLSDATQPTYASSQTTFTTKTQVWFANGSLVTFAGTGTALDGTTGIAIAAAPSTSGATFTFKVAGNWTTGTYTGGTVSLVAAVVADKDATTATRNYTIINTSSDGTKLFLASEVAAGNYADTSGDYFHRIVPWKPVSPSCDPTKAADASYPSNQSACGGTSNDAPNNDATNFNAQITAWCTTCHTRYYAAVNAKPTYGDFGARPATQYAITKINATTGLITTKYYPGYAAAATIVISGTGTILDGNTYYVKATTYPSSPNYWADGGTYGFTISETNGGAAVVLGGSDVLNQGTVAATVNQANAQQSWWYPRPNATGSASDGTYKFQHQTTTNRACTTCHVSHGSNAKMTGNFSSDAAYPSGTTSASSRLLKFDNRGTCIACHDPTETVVAGSTVGSATYNSIP